MADIGDVWVSRLIIAYMKKMRFSIQLEAVQKAVASSYVCHMSICLP